jgi:hypothetical protein
LWTSNGGLWGGGWGGEGRRGNLAKFGYMTDMKVSLKMGPSIFLAIYCNLSYQCGDLEQKKSEFGKVYISWKILRIGWNHIFQVKIWEKLASKKFKHESILISPTATYK